MTVKFFAKISDQRERTNAVRAVARIGWRPCRPLNQLTVVVLAALLGWTAPAAAQSVDPMASQASWQPPSWSELRADVLAWLESTDADEPQRRAVMLRWPEQEPQPGRDRLADLMKTFALVDPDVKSLVDALTVQDVPLALPETDWLADSDRAEIVRANCRLFAGRFAARHRLYDEAFQQLDALQPGEVADPASLLFYQAVVRQRLLQRKPALEALEQLLESEEHVPRRYLAVARLMQSDLAGLEDDSLDHIARRMDDIRRRLELGRAGEKVREIEDGVIESLDKLIEKAKKRQQQQSSSGMPSGSQQQRPAQDSRILGGRGPGEVTKKDIGDAEGWGNLPPKQREAALQQIGREFPAHYRDAIEQYFRRLAGSESDSP